LIVVQHQAQAVATHFTRLILCVAALNTKNEEHNSNGENMLVVPRSTPPRHKNFLNVGLTKMALLV
jgi:hypothetical protein